MARDQASKTKHDKPKREDERRVIATNRKARHDYFVLEAYETGIELRGSEVKSLRDAKCQLQDAYATVEGGQLFLRGAHINPYDPAALQNHDPTRARRLLMHRAEIRRLAGRLEESGLTLVPLSLYFKNGKVKVELALVRGRREYDKRAKLDERRSRRELRGVMRGERPE